MSVGLIFYAGPIRGQSSVSQHDNAGDKGLQAIHLIQALSSGLITEMSSGSQHDL